MKIHILSDLHLEICNFKPLADSENADIIVLAGDIAVHTHGIRWARKNWPDKAIIYVPGNHEFYGYDMEQTRKDLRIAADKENVHLLDMGEVVINGTRFLGCTGWTDMELFGAAKKQLCINKAAIGLNDFYRIKHPDGKLGRFTPEQSVGEHRECVKWLEQKLIHEKFAGETVVITHHAPSFKSVVPRYQNDLLSACFASRLDQLMGRADVWIHGHMHDSSDYKINGTRVIANPRGYARFAGACENSSFKPGLIVEVGASHDETLEKSESMQENNAATIKALLGLQIQSDGEDGFQYYDLNQLPEELHEAYWKDRMGSTQPFIAEGVDSIYRWDWEEWRDSMLRFCGHSVTKGNGL